MKIGINYISLPSEKGSGVFRYMQLMFKAMADYNIGKVHFIIYKQKQISAKYLGIPDEFDVEYIDVPTLGSGMKRVLFEQTLFYFFLKPCDILYSYCTSLPLLTRCKKVFTLHDVYYLTTKERYGLLQRTYLSWVTKLYCKACDKVMTVSQYSYNEIMKYLGLKDDKLVLTYNFILHNGNAVIKRPDRLTDVFGNLIDIDKPYFFYVGDIQPGKNIKNMVDGFLQYAIGRKDIQLLVAGKSQTPYGEEMVSYMQSLKNVSYLGYLSREAVNWLQANCKGTVLLSLCEGFGIPPLEGFSYDKPALTSNTTSLPEVVGRAGVMVDPTRIDQIAFGYKSLEEQHDVYIHYIPEQLAKFDPHKSVERFMDTLGIQYSLKQ